MTKQEIIDYMYENHVQGDFKIEEMAEDLAQPQWIPVSERMPEEGTEVLGTDDHGCIRHVVKDKCGLYEFATYEEMMHIDIVAWMPLPDPYKEDKT